MKVSQEFLRRSGVLAVLLGASAGCGDRSHATLACAVEDMPRGRHEHRAPGEGDMDLPAVLGALAGVAYPGLVSLELSRDSHRADVLVGMALAALKDAEDRGRAAA